MPFLDHLRFAELQNTRGIYYADRGEFKKAITIFLQGLDVWENHNFSSERTLDIRIRYNVSKAYFKIKEYNKAILHCDRAIERCVEEDTLCIYADLHYLRGQILYDCGAWEESFQMFTLAKTMFETSKQTQFLEITQKKMRELFSAPTKNQSVKMEI